jgi:hypothetical protein
VRAGARECQHNSARDAGQASTGVCR